MNNFSLLSVITQKRYAQSSTRKFSLVKAIATLALFSSITTISYSGWCASQVEVIDDNIYQARFYASAEKDNAIDGSYIVVFKDDTTTELNKSETRTFVEQTANRMANLAGGRVTHHFLNGVKGFAMEMDSTSLIELMAQNEIAYIEQDTWYSINAVQQNPTWGLDRIDQRLLPLDNLYNSTWDGTGVNVYIIDTGADIDHPEFNGRMNFGFDITPGNGGEDCNGHGTHVAGIIGSNTYGVAKNSNLFSIRVFGCGTLTSLSNILAGMEWVIENAELPAVANLSLGGGTSTTQDDLVQAMVDAGIVVVVSAGNDNADACDASPARAPNAITVASSTSDDSRASTSNFGSCVDLFAPGSDILSTGIDSTLTTLSGSSMASPHVAGVAALILQSNNNASVAETTNTLLTNATTGVISDTQDSPNRLAFMGFLNEDQNQTPTPTPTQPPLNVTCTFEDDFSNDSGWVNDSASTCDSGAFVRANPSFERFHRVVTQVGGDASGDGFALFTGINNSVGSDDVDNGVCITNSPTIAVAEDSVLSIDWFHGQSKPGDDPGGDFFRLEYSLNGGSSFNPLVQLGDKIYNAQWKTASASIPAGSSVVIRVSVSDGPYAGDLVEGGIDSVSICANSNW